LSTNFTHSEVCSHFEIPTALAVCMPSPTAMNGVDLNYWAWALWPGQSFSLTSKGVDLCGKR
jgi:hypothetical protein